MTTKTLLLIDGNSLVHRLYHALPPLTAKDGRPIQAIYGLGNILLKLFREGKTDYAAACFDRPEPTYRDIAFEEYKAQRPVTPDELIGQLKEAHVLFPLFGIKTFEAPGFEADDLIATLAMRFKNEKGLRVVILTGDLDTLQLVEDDHIAVRTFRKGISDTFIYNEAAVKDRFGLPPKHMIDYKALVGDPSDNIKGVPGVGPKTAVELIKKFGSVENIYKHLAEDEKLAKRFAPFEKEALLSKHLVSLQYNAPVGTDPLSSLAVHESKEKLADYFSSLGFTKILERMNGGSGETPSVPKPQKLGSLFDTKPVAMPSTNMNKQEAPAEDCVFISPKSLATLTKTARTSKKSKVGFGLKAAIKELRAEKQELAPPYFDLGIAYWLLDPDEKSYEPEPVFQTFLKSEWRGTDTDLARAYRFAEAALNTQGLTKVFRDIEMPLLPILADMEIEGIGVSRDTLRALGEKMDMRIATLTKEIYTHARGEFNLNSPKQLGAVLFEKLKLGGKKKTPGGQRATGADTLEMLRAAHPIIPLILNYREDFKIKSTYVEPLQVLPDAQGRLHTEFVQTGTATGRLSSRVPNLQNIPQESPWAKDLRNAFVARPGFSFLSFDFSQIELRIMASLADDPSMRSAFENNIDIHALTASKVLKKSLDEITKSDRRLAKALNFGLIYGMGKSAFAKAGGISTQEASLFIENYFKEFSRVRDWQERIKKEAYTQGILVTPTGRRRLFPDMNLVPLYVRAEMERAALNFPIQSLASDMVKFSMIEGTKLLREHGFASSARLILSIHDELLFEVRNDTIQEIAQLIGPTMERIYPLRVPFRVNISCGSTWGRLEELSPAYADPVF